MYVYVLIGMYVHDDYVRRVRVIELAKRNTQVI